MRWQACFRGRATASVGTRGDLEGTRAYDRGTGSREGIKPGGSAVFTTGLRGDERRSWPFSQAQIDRRIRDRRHPVDRRGDLAGGRIDRGVGRELDEDTSFRSTSNDVQGQKRVERVVVRSSEINRSRQFFFQQRRVCRQ